MIDGDWAARFSAIVRGNTWRNGLLRLGADAYSHELDVQREPTATLDVTALVRLATALQILGASISIDDASSEGVLETGRFWEAYGRVRSDKSTESTLMAAFAYSAAGSSANSMAVVRKYRASNPAGTPADPLLECVTLLLERRLLALRATVSELKPADYTRAGLITAGAIESVEELAEYLLSGEHYHLESAMETLRHVLRASVSGGAVWEHLLADGLARFAKELGARSIWTLLGQTQTAAPALWRRYLMLLARGLGRDLLGGSSITELWPSQREAIEAGLLDSEVPSFAARMPTSAGKTRVAEMAMVKALADGGGARVIYIAPFRALANELTAGFRRLFGDLGFSVTSSASSYLYEEHETELLSDYDVAVLTPEKLDLLDRLNAHALSSVSLVVLDEGHILGSEDRGVKTELLLTRLRLRLPNARFLVVSAVVSDRGLAEIANWLSGRSLLHLGRSATSSWRPAHLQLAVFDWREQAGTLRLIDSTNAASSQNS